jgi:hypothetical protein
MEQPDKGRRADPERNAGPAWRGADVAFLPGERRSAQRATARLFGRSLRRWEYAGLCGAPHGACVEVGTLRGQLYVQMHEPTRHRYQAAWRLRAMPGGPLLIAECLPVAAGRARRNSLEFRIFQRQVCYAKALGVIGIKALATRRRGDRGYCVWPSVGFDGRLPRAIRQRLPCRLAPAQSLLDVVQTKEGCRWWRRHGATIRVRFDLAEQSRSWQVFLRGLRPVAGR